MNAPLAFGGGHALHAVHAAFIAQMAIGVLAGDLEDDFAISAAIGFGGGKDFDLPAVALGVARVHAEEIGREERGLVPTGAGPNFDDDVLGVVRILGHQQRLDAAHERRPADL